MPRVRNKVYLRRRIKAAHKWTGPLPLTKAADQAQRAAELRKRLGRMGFERLRMRDTRRIAGGSRYAGARLYLADVSKRATDAARRMPRSRKLALAGAAAGLGYAAYRYRASNRQRAGTGSATAG